ncbi:MAG: SHOCT domain-containing protein [Halobacterium sp.]
MSTEHGSNRLVWVALAVVAVVVLLPVLVMTVGMLGFGMMGTPMMGWGGGMGPRGGMQAPGWTFLLGPVMQLLFLVVLVGGGYVFYRRVAENAASSDPALEELRVAYARGELSDEEFEERRRRLQERE